MAGPYVSSDERNYLGFGHQSAKGSGVAPTKFLPAVSTVDLDHGQEAKAHYELGNGPYMSLHEKLKHDPSGKATAFCRPSYGGFIGAHLMGVDTVGAAVSGVYPHVLTSDQAVDWTSVEYCLADELVERITDAVIFEVVYSAEAGNENYIRQEISYAGITVAKQVSAASDAYETDRPFHWNDSVFTIDGASDSACTKWSVAYRWKLADNIRTGGVARAYLLKLAVEVEVSLTQIMLSDAAYRLVNYGSAVGTTVQALLGQGDFTMDANYGAAGTARQMKLECPVVEWDMGRYTGQNPEGEEVYFERHGVGIRPFGGANPIHRQTWKTLDSASYLA